MNGGNGNIDDNEITTKYRKIMQVESTDEMNEEVSSSTGLLNGLLPEPTASSSSSGEETTSMKEAQKEALTINRPDLGAANAMDGAVMLSLRNCYSADNTEWEESIASMMAKYIRLDKARLKATIQSSTQGSCLLEVTIYPATCVDEITTAYVMDLLEDVVAYESTELMQMIHDDGTVPPTVMIDQTVYFVANTPEDMVVSNAIWGDGTSKDHIEDTVEIKSPFEQYKWYHYIIVGWLVGTMIYMTIRKYRRQKQSRIQREYMMRQYDNPQNFDGIGMGGAMDDNEDMRRYSMSMKGPMNPMDKHSQLGLDYTDYVDESAAKHEHVMIHNDPNASATSSMLPRRNSMPSTRATPTYDGRRDSVEPQYRRNSMGSMGERRDSFDGRRRRTSLPSQQHDRRQSLGSMGERRGSTGVFEQKSSARNDVRRSEPPQRLPRRGSRGDNRPQQQQQTRVNPRNKRNNEPVRRTEEKKRRKKNKPMKKEERQRRRGSGTGLSMMGRGGKKTARRSSGSGLGLSVDTNTHRRPNIGRPV